MESWWETWGIPEISPNFETHMHIFKAERQCVRMWPKNNHVGWVPDIGPHRFNCSLNQSLGSAFTFTLLNPHWYNSCKRDHLINQWVSGQTGLHYADTGLELCSFQQIATMTDEQKQEYICISGSQYSFLMSNVRLRLEYTENTQNKPTSPPNWHAHKGKNKGMYLWASGCVSVRSGHW